MPVLFHFTSCCFPPFLVVLLNYVGHQHFLDFVRRGGISVTIDDELYNSQMIHRCHAL